MIDFPNRTIVYLCFHVFNGAPVLRAERTEPLDELDSGWQFLCNLHEENWKEAKITTVDNALKREPSLEKYIDHPYDITLVRKDEFSDWEKV